MPLLTARCMVCEISVDAGLASADLHGLLRWLRIAWRPRLLHRLRRLRSRASGDRAHAAGRADQSQPRTAPARQDGVEQPVLFALALTPDDARSSRDPPAHPAPRPARGRDGTGNV